MKKFLLSLMAVFACVSMHADEWSINFAEIGAANGLEDKAGATIGAAVDNGMGNVTLGEPLNTNFGIQTGTTWLYRTAQKALYSQNGGGRNFGVFNAKAKQIITLDISAAPTPTNATLKSTSGNVRTYEVTADGTVTFNLARYNYIYSIAVSNPSSTEVEYTVKYVDAEGKELKESTKNSGEPGSAIVVGDVEKASFVAEGMKYIYVSDDSEGKTIAADGSSVVTLVFRQAASYVVNAKFNGNVISTANVFEGDEAYVYAPYYQLVEGKLYNTPAVDKGTLSYGQVKLGNVTADTDINVTYTEDATQNAVFYAEGEDIATCKPVKDGYTEIRMSNGAAGYADNSVITTLEPGVYTLTTSSRSGITNFTVNGVNVKTLTSTGAVVTETSSPFTVNKAAELVASCDKSTSYFDFVLIRKTGEAPKNTIAAGKYSVSAKIVAKEGLNVPAELQKYVLSGDERYVTFGLLAGDENELKVAANEGIVNGFTINGDAVQYAATDTFAIAGKKFNICSADGANKAGEIKLANNGGIYESDSFGIMYNGVLVGTANVSFTIVNPDPSVIFSWESFGGTPYVIGAIENAAAPERVNYKNSWDGNDYWTICLNGKNDFAINATVTPTKAFQGGETIEITGYYNKGEEKQCSVAFAYENDTKVNDTQYYADIQNGVENIKTYTYTVPAAAAGSTFVKLSRNKAGTNIFITNLVIKASQTTGINGVSAVNEVVKAKKYVKNGMIIIENNGKKFTVAGQAL